MKILKIAVYKIGITVLDFIYLIFKCLPRKNLQKIVLLSREGTEPSSDFLLLKCEINKISPNTKIVILTREIKKNILGLVKYCFCLLRESWEISNATVLVLDTYSIVASNLHHKKNLKIIQIWHSLGALKKFGLSAVGLKEGRAIQTAKLMKMHNNYNFVLASSNAAAPFFAKSFGVNESCVFVCPLPRADALVQIGAKRERSYNKKKPLTVLYAPTFRVGKPICANIALLKKLFTKNGFTFIYKEHPIFQKDIKSESNAELFQKADVFVTDYSSMVFEAALAKIPCYFLAIDLNEYVDSRGFFIDYKAQMPGKIFNNEQDLVNAICEDFQAGNKVDIKKLEDFANKWVEMPKDGSTALNTLTKFILA